MASGTEVVLGRVEDLRTVRAKRRLLVVALAVAAMLGAPFVLLHGGAQKVAAAPPAARHRPTATSLGRTQLIASARPSGPSAAVLARHRSAVRHNEAVRRARARWHAMRVHEAAVLAAGSSGAHLGATHRRAPAGSSPTVTLHGHSAVGIATWYAWNVGQCASPFLPHGTLLTVTDLTTGKTIQCLVTDTEAHNPGRVVDLSNWCFEELAPLSQGVIEVRITW